MTPEDASSCAGHTDRGLDTSITQRGETHPAPLAQQPHDTTIEIKV